MRQICLCILLAGATAGLAGQTRRSVHLPDMMRIAAEITDDGSASDTYIIIEMLSELAESPVIINSGDSTEISRLFFLSPAQVKSLIGYVRYNGPVVSPAELAALNHFSRQTAEIMLPFISFELSDRKSDVQSAPGRFYHRATLTHSASFDDGSTAQVVNPFRTSLRYRASSRNIAAVFTAASDPGESPLLAGKPDFISAGVEVTGSGRVTSFIAGDYSARFGMGLTINSGYKPFLTLTSVSYMGHRDGFSLSTSPNESNYLRGAAATISAGGLQIAAMTSVRYRDARFKTDDMGNTYADILSSPQARSSLSGVSAGGVLRESSYGINAGFGSGRIRWALTACLTDFSHDVREGEAPENGNRRFSGTRTFNSGISYRMASGRVTAAGEFAVSATGAAAMAHTVNVRFDDRLTGNFVYRNYGKYYYGHLAAGPGRNALTGNEEGLMARITFEAARNLFLSAGADVYRFPWLKSGTSSPSYGYKSELRAAFTPVEAFEAEFRMYGSTSAGNSSAVNEVPGLAEAGQLTSRVSFKLSPSEKFSFTITALRKMGDGSGPGTMMAADAALTPLRWPLSLWLRYAAFSSPGFPAGLYLYENDLLYGFRIPVHYGEGSRLAAVLAISVGEWGDLRLKYGLMTRALENRRMLDEEVKMQISLSF